MKGTGILLDDTFDLQINPVYDAAGKILSGLVVGDVLYQNQAVILTIQPGELKLSPLVGVGIESLLLNNDFPAMRRRIRQQLEADGQKVYEILFLINKKTVIDATYR